MKRKYSGVSKETQAKKKKTVYRKTPSSSDHRLLMALKKNVFQHEKKYCDTYITSGYSLAGTATITLLNPLIQGVDENSRIGRQINMKSVFLRGSVCAANTTVGQGAVRTIIVLDQEVPQVSGSGQTMTITDFLHGDGLYSPNNLDNRKRFKVLFDEQQDFSGCTVNTGNKNTYLPYMYKKIDYTTEFNGNNNGNIGDFTKNALYLVTYSTGLSVAAPNVILYARVRFTDN